MLLIVVAATVSFIFAQKQLTDYANSISKLNADAQTGDQNLGTLSRLKSKLTEDADLIARTRSVVADNSTYGDQFLSDIGRIAQQSGVNVTGIEFTDGAAAQGTTNPAEPGGSSSTSQLSGVTKKTVQVSVDSPLSYASLMKFLQGIETNPMKMQVATVSLTKDKGNNVTTPDFIIEVYVRQ